MTNLILFDIDGTIALGTKREHLLKPGPDGKINWDAYFLQCHTDEPIYRMQVLIASLSASANITLLFASGRPERIRFKTAAWLWDNYEVDVSGPYPDYPRRLYMRKDGDHRPDYIVKSEILDMIIVDYKTTPLMVFDDRDSVVKMWRERGIACMHVTDKGDF
jgi:hypothetical protein